MIGFSASEFPVDSDIYFRSPTDAPANSVELDSSVRQGCVECCIVSLELIINFFFPVWFILVSRTFF